MFMALAKAQDWHAIVKSFKRGGIAWAKDDAEALWIIAEAYARENDCGEAYVVYRLDSRRSRRPGRAPRDDRARDRPDPDGAMPRS